MYQLSRDTDAPEALKKLARVDALWIDKVFKLNRWCLILSLVTLTVACTLYDVATSPLAHLIIIGTFFLNVAVQSLLCISLFFCVMPEDVSQCSYFISSDCLNESCLVDIRAFSYPDGPLYVAVVLDRYSERAIGCAVSTCLYKRPPRCSGWVETSSSLLGQLAVPTW